MTWGTLLPTEHILNQLLEVWRLYMLIYTDRLTSPAPAQTLTKYKASLAFSKLTETGKPNPSLRNTKTWATRFGEAAYEKWQLLEEKKYFKEHCNLHTIFPPGYISLESKKQNAFRRLHCPCQDVNWSPSNAVYLCCKNLFHPWTQGSNSKGTSVAYDRALGSSRHRLCDLNESPSILI